MKYYLALFALILFSVINAQEILKITYSSQMKIEDDFSDLDVPTAQKEAYKKMLKDAMEEVHYFDLVTTSTESTYKKVEKINNDLPQENGMKISVSAGGTFNYKNIITKEVLELRKSFNENYIIKDTLEDFDWKITREKDQILGYEVRKAMHTDSMRTITAWYAPKIAMKTGPADYWGLPGLILKVDVALNNEENTRFYFQAQELKVDSEAKIEKPTGGKVISEKEYMAIMQEISTKFKEMRESGVDTSD
ncbi:GLPGLI family protein [Flavobacteriaceae bacterium Ap0902]|nr:GLPGLI family protein [Flavobacteriaceae bacterium Ap0902]